MILVLMVFPACWMARLPSLYTLRIETVAYILPSLVTAVMTVPVITGRRHTHIHTGHDTINNLIENKEQKMLQTYIKRRITVLQPAGRPVLRAKC